MKRLIIAIAACIVTGNMALASEVPGKSQQEKVPEPPCKAQAKTEMETVVLGFSLNIDEEKNDSLQQVYYKQGVVPSDVLVPNTDGFLQPSDLPVYVIYLLPVMENKGVNPNIYQVL